MQLVVFESFWAVFSQLGVAFNIWNFALWLWKILQSVPICSVCKKHSFEHKACHAHQAKTPISFHNSLTFWLLCVPSAFLFHVNFIFWYETKFALIWFRNIWESGLLLKVFVEQLGKYKRLSASVLKPQVMWCITYLEKVFFYCTYLRKERECPCVYTRSYMNHVDRKVEGVNT